MSNLKFFKLILFGLFCISISSNLFLNVFYYKQLIDFVLQQSTDKLFISYFYKKYFVFMLFVLITFFYLRSQIDFKFLFILFIVLNVTFFLGFFNFFISLINGLFISFEYGIPVCYFLFGLFFLTLGVYTIKKAKQGIVE